MAWARPQLSPRLIDAYSIVALPVLGTAEGVYDGALYEQVFPTIPVAVILVVGGLLRGETSIVSSRPGQARRAEEVVRDSASSMLHSSWGAVGSSVFMATAAGSCPGCPFFTVIP